jgi:AcrR family transcriptional regulator
VGRPRQFDIDKVIAIATNLFWEKGYEGTSLIDLTKAIGITPPSFYFAFGSKEGLFRKVIERYYTGYLVHSEEAFREPTAPRGRRAIAIRLCRPSDQSRACAWMPCHEQCSSLWGGRIRSGAGWPACVRR